MQSVDGRTHGHHLIEKKNHHHQKVVICFKNSRLETKNCYRLYREKGQQFHSKQGVRHFYFKKNVI